MDAIDLLAREDEFKKLNKQLEKKSESLMKQIETVLQKQDTFSEFSTNIRKHSCEDNYTSNQNDIKITKIVPTQKNLVKRLPNDTGPSAKEKCDCCVLVPNDNMEFLYAFVSVNVKEKILPQSFAKDNITIEKVCKFLSSKIKLLQEQIDKLQNKMKTKSTQCESHLTQLADLENERMTLLNKNNNMKTATIEMKAKCHALQNRIDEKESYNKEQRCQIDKLSCELKRLKSKTLTLEARCASHEQTIDNLRQQIETLKIHEKDLRETNRNLSSENQNKITKLESHINIKNKQTDRQTKLIKNLRRQIHLLNLNGAFKILEQNYSKLLNEEI